MQKVVDNGIKIDLHIHSYYSKEKDPDKVQENTIENLPVLINGLISEQVEMCAITDHDTFNYEMYKTLKEEESKDNCIKKVLPGIEFSVEFIEGKESIHIVTIFSDLDENKVKNIETVMKSPIGKFKNRKSCYTKNEYFEILNQINLDFVMIAHQKNSVLSNNSKKHDVMSLGKNVFNEFVFMDYFDAFEFRSKKNEVYQKTYSAENSMQENLRFITGSDCHRWKHYPYTEPNEHEEFGYTYIKSLPTFRGLVMAITDPHRINISCNFYNLTEQWLDKLDLCINGQDVSVPLSKGINVIIGDNSVGKSLLLNAITNYYKITDKERNLKKGYIKYLANNSIEIKNTIPESDIFMFNRQGEIRGIFDTDGIKPNKFLEQFYPSPIDAEKYRKIADKEFDKLYTALEQKFKYDESISKLPSFKFFVEDVLMKNLSIVGTVQRHDLDALHRLLKNLDEIISKIKDEILTNEAIKEVDKIYMQNAIEPFEIIREKYRLQLVEKKAENERINIFNTFTQNFTLEYNQKNSSEHIMKNDFLNNINESISAICALMKQRKRLIPFSFNMPPIKVIPETNPVNEYQFVSKIGIEEINKSYLENVLSSVLSKKAKINISEINISEITSDGLGSIILKFTNDDSQTPLEALKEKVGLKLDKDFRISTTAIKGNMDVFEQLSTGFDAQTYFTLICGEARSKGIYLIDQPEDHISQKAIKENVIEQFRKMGRCRQVIMVTHNPQFIVNLDVDNVIFLTKEQKEFKVYSGALEYANDEYNILKIIADNIEGGLKTILGRMKRYEKNI